ncbi:MAG: hypothetical protein C0485_13410 [Pirellula sp.]|nr:hypothetical protein [Pirellula sp.]
MPYDDDDDLFGEEFDFVDDDDSDDDDSELEEKPKAKPTKKKPAAKDKEKADKPASRAPKRAPRGAGKTEKPAAKRESRRDDEPKSTEPKSPGPIPKLPPAKSLGDKAPVGYLSFAHGLDIDDEEDDEPPFAAAPPAIEKAPVAEARFEEPAPTPAPAPPEPTGPPADHVIHIYEFGKLKRTIPRKFTDEQAVGFAEEFTRTNKAYGRYAVATPDDEEPAETFAGAAKQ